MRFRFLGTKFSPNAYSCTVFTAPETCPHRPEISATFLLPVATAGLAADAIASDGDHWDDEFLKLVGPEIYRRPLKALPADETVTWLRAWARRFLRPGQQLTTPVTTPVVDLRAHLCLIQRCLTGTAMHPVGVPAVPALAQVRAPSWARP